MRAFRTLSRRLGVSTLLLALGGCGGGEPAAVMPASDLDAAIGALVGPGAVALDLSSIPSIQAPVPALGRALFFSRSLSGDGDVACVSCHHPLLGGADGLSLSVGVQSRQPLWLGPGRRLFPDAGLDPVAKDGPNVPRNAPTTFNIAFYDRFMFHDGRVHPLVVERRPNGAGQPHRTPDSFQNLPDPAAGADLTATQARFPVTSLFEMRGYGDFAGLDNQGTRAAIEQRLRQSPEWLAAFRSAFGQADAAPDTLITYGNIQRALGEYQRSQVFVDHAWGRYVRGDKEAVGEDAKRGALLFYRRREEGGAGCVACHSGGHFTDESFHVSGFPQIGRGKNTAQQDFGRFEATQHEPDRYAFRTPSLLNVALTAPYGHAGTFDTLEEVIRYHVDPGAGARRFDYSLQSLSQFEGLQVAYPNIRNNVALAAARFSSSPSRALLENPGLSAGEIAYLAAFLRSLTDACAQNAECLRPWIADAAVDNPDGLMLEACFDEGVVPGRACPPDPPRSQTPPAPPVPPALSLEPDLSAKAAEAARLTSCPNGLGSAGNSTERRFTRLAPATTGIDHAHGYSFAFWTENLVRMQYLMVNGAVALGDVDGDCWQDLLFASGLQGNLLYRGEAGFTFAKLAVGGGAESTSSVAIADLNADYRPEVLMGSYPVSGTDTIFTLYENRWPQMTARASSSTGIRFRRNTSSISVGDYNNDGWPDVIMGLWTVLANAPADNHLWKNLGALTFAGVDAKVGLSGIANAVDRSFAPAITDFNNDGRPDVLMVGDFETSQVFVQNEEGSFAKVTDRSVISDENGMGSTVADFDNDGDLDWFVTSIYTPSPLPGSWGGSGNRLYRNSGGGRFEDVTDEAGVRDGAWGWGSCAADFDNDGDLDLFHVNGYALPDQVWEYYRLVVSMTGTPPYFEFMDTSARLFMNDGEGRFTRAEVDWGVDDRSGGRGVACLDADRDGDMDLVLVNNSAAPSVYRNETGSGAGRHFLSLRLVGNAPGTDALGARIYLEAEGKTQMREVSLNSNYLGNNPLDQHFGLGGAAVVDSIRIVWPRTGQVTELSNVPVNQFIVVAEP